MGLSQSVYKLTVPRLHDLSQLRHGKKRTTRRLKINHSKMNSSWISSSSWVSSWLTLLLPLMMMIYLQFQLWLWAVISISRCSWQTANFRRRLLCMTSWTPDSFGALTWIITRPTTPIGCCVFCCCQRPGLISNIQ